MLEKFVQKTGFISILFVLTCQLGCEFGSKPQTDSVAPPASSRPALRILIVDAPELEKEISVQWQAASDQLLKIENISSNDIGTRDPFNADIVIYPSVLLGDLIKKEAISRLPGEAIRKDTDSESTHDSVVFSWPIRWRNSVSFGDQLFAVPLGANSLCLIQGGIDPSYMDDLQKRMSTTKDLKNQPLELWDRLLQDLETASVQSLNERELLLQQRLQKIDQETKDCLVDRFLFIASTSNARSRGLFDLLKMESRLAQPDFVNAAKILSRMARLSPDTILVGHAKAWGTAVANKEKTSFAIGWPSTSTASSDEDFGTIGTKTVAPIAWNPGRGLIASVGKKTKQTAVSCQFLFWLGQSEQRDSLRAVCSRIELLPGQLDRNSGREDYRNYQTINNRDSRVEPMELSLRMANANQYRAVLEESLVAALITPEQIDSALAACATQWDELTAKLGIDSQRISEEQSLGYRK